MNAEDSKYTLKKEGAMYVVRLKTRPSLIQFQSTKRPNCRDWIDRMEGKQPEYEEELPQEA